MVDGSLATSTRSPFGRSWPRRLLKVLSLLVISVAALVVTLAGWAWWSLRGSLPELDDERELTGLKGEVRIERDALGIPTLRGSHRLDVALATGYVHGQDRFFQMDLLRRRATGELGGLLGRRARDADARIRVHRLRQVARRALDSEPPARQALIEAYARGVNAGLDSLARPPFEYLVLRTAPAAWKPEDSYAVLLAMFLQVQGENGEYESALGLLRDELPPALFEFLTPRGTEWDTAIDSTILAGGPLPTSEEVRLATTHSSDSSRPIGPRLDQADGADAGSTADTGSNAWAVAGSRTADGRAILANDMHLGLSLPNIWYRAALVWPGHEVTGITLPGVPVIVSGSNGRVAWGFTNSQIDTSDVILFSPEEADDDTYLTPTGREPYRRHQETLRFSDGSEEILEVVWTRWGPLLATDHRGRRKAVRWVGHEPAAVNLHLLELETAANVDQAVAIANRSGMPAQNLLTADADGRIAWTIAGILPRRVGFDGRLPGSWSDGSRSWRGWLAPEEVPRVIDPESGLLWSANQRMVGGEMLAKLGDGSYMLAARARQIRDRLEALDQPRELDM
ncbi:MAG: penicillin acylase family protein, partial [Acidobacteriota bacterium]